MSAELRERIARALYEYECDPLTDPLAYRGFDGVNNEPYYRKADAVLAVLDASKEPADLTRRALLTEAFADAQAKAGEPLSPWAPEGFALIADRALAQYDALHASKEPAGLTSQLAEALRRLVARPTAVVDIPDRNDVVAARAALTQYDALHGETKTNG